MKLNKDLDRKKNEVSLLFKKKKLLKKKYKFINSIKRYKSSNIWSYLVLRRIIYVFVYLFI